MRRSTDWLEDFPAVVRRAFAEPHRSAYDGWEPLADCRDRVLAAARRILSVHGDQDVVMVGHGTAWTLLAAELTGSEPDLDRWESLGMPDVVEVPSPLR